MQTPQIDVNASHSGAFARTDKKGFLKVAESLLKGVPAAELLQMMQEPESADRSGVVAADRAASS